MVFGFKVIYDKKDWNRHIKCFLYLESIFMQTKRTEKFGDDTCTDPLEFHASLYFKAGVAAHRSNC